MILKVINTAQKIKFSSKDFLAIITVQKFQWFEWANGVQLNC